MFHQGNVAGNLEYVPRRVGIEITPVERIEYLPHDHV